MREIGGYIELDTYRGEMLHDEAIKLNSGRHALEYLIIAKNIKKMYFPKLMCDSNDAILARHEVEVTYYSVGADFRPIIDVRDNDKWLYVVNYYGQLPNEYLASLGDNVIVDNTNSYFQEPLQGVDTLYSCRKYFGVSDGALLYTDTKLGELPQDKSGQRMSFLYGRFEGNASDYYAQYADNNELFSSESLKSMSKLTENLLHAIDYEFVKKRREANFRYLHEQFKGINRLELIVPEGPFMYPLYIEGGGQVRKALQAIKIYIPTLWPDVYERCDESELEFDLVRNTLPLPIDQRYDESDMQYLVDEIKKLLR